MESYEEFDEKRRSNERLIADDEDMATLEKLRAIVQPSELQ